MLDYFKSFFKKKKPTPTVSGVIELSHKNGEKITITVTGVSSEQVAYITNRIKEVFKIPHNQIDPKVYQDMNKVWEQTDKYWEEADKLFKKYTNLFKH
jgi:capsular polysaccharide biosynthesis protein